MGLNFKGIITIEVDHTLVHATMRIVRGGDLVYDEGAVLRTISDAGVKEGFDPDEAIEIVQKFQRSKENETREIFARGELPTPAQGEEWLWNDSLETSDSLKASADRATKLAGPPEIFDVRIVKTPVEKKVEKSGLFAKGKEESVVAFETKEVREKVLVDPNPLRVLYVEEGARVAQLTPALPGKPGRDLQGKTIPPAPAKTSKFFTGKNLEKRKAEVIATTSGFLRVGKTWADIVPFTQHSWSVSFSEDRANAFLTFRPGNAEAPRINPQQILDKLHDEKFPLDRVIDPGELQTIIQASIARKEPIEGRSLTNDRDATYEITFSADRTKAFLNIEKAFGNGKPLSLRDLGQTLRDAKLKGLNFDAVKASIMEFVSGPNTEFKDFLLVQGKPPTRGKDKELEFLTDFMTSEEWLEIKKRVEADPRLLETVPDQDQLSLSAVQKATVVAEGQKFAVLKEPDGGFGEPGIDIAGEKIPPMPGNDPPLLLLSNVRRNGDNLEAVHDGILEFAKKDETTIFRVRFHVDAKVLVKRSEDNMTATLTLVQGRGSGKKLDRSEIAKALEMEQVTFGIDEKKIEEAFNLALVGQKVEDLVVARGRPSGHDLEKRLSFQIPLKKDTAGIQRGLVHDQQKIAEYQPPEGGNPDGADVMGNIIPSNDGEVATLRVSEDFEVKWDGNVQSILALKNGEMQFDGQALTLRTEMTVGPINAKTGNLKFPGEILVNGNVETGLYILAGNLKIKGQVGGALLSSEANIQVAEGIRGEGKAVLRAKKHISCGFVERTVLLAVGDIHVLKTALGCNIKCNGKVYQKSTEGAFVGGLTKTKFGMDVVNLGSAKGTQTVISFGQDYLIEDQIDAEMKETDKLRESIVHLDGLMTRLMNPSDKDKLANARKKKVILLKLLEKRNLKLINLRDKFELHYPSEIIVRENLYPGVSIESHGRLFEVKTKKGRVKIVFNQNTGHIEEQPLG